MRDELIGNLQKLLVNLLVFSRVVIPEQNTNTNMPPRRGDYYLLSNDICCIGPAVKCLLEHLMSVEVATLISVWIHVVVVIECAR